jgi:hypothetical protein
MKFTREQYRELLSERWGSHDETDREIEEFLTATIGSETHMSIEDFIDVCFGLFRTDASREAKCLMLLRRIRVADEKTDTVEDLGGEIVNMIGEINHLGDSVLKGRMGKVS